MNLDIDHLAAEFKSDLAEHAAEIRRLGRRAVEDVIEIGHRLVVCKDILGHGNWLPWLDREFGWGESTAHNYMRLYELAQAKSTNFADLNLPVSTLYLLAAPGTPEPVRDQILERAVAGEQLPNAEVKRAIAGAKKTISAGSRAKVNTAQSVTVTDGTLDVEGATGDPEQSAEERKRLYESRQHDHADGEQVASDGFKQPGQDPRVRGTTGAGENEWYTPEKYIELARLVLGGIDFDPASSDVAQRVVRAERYFTQETDGLKQEWHGRVWLNPPYSQPLVADFIAKLIAERNAGLVTAAILLTHNHSDTAWFKDAAASANAICFMTGRVKFYAPDGAVANPTQDQTFFYYGDDLERFASVFCKVGIILSVTPASSVIDDFFTSAGSAEIYDRTPVDKRDDLLRAFPIDHVIEVRGKELRARLPANPICKLRSMDDATAAETLHQAFGARLGVIVGMVREQNAPKGARRRKLTMVPTGTDASENPNFAQAARNRSRAKA